MKKLKPIFLLALALVTLAFASCANQPATADNQSPMNRNQGNGLASYMH